MAKDTEIVPYPGLEMRDAQMRVSEGSYRPEWLGLNLPEVKWLHVGYCVLKPLEGLFGFDPGLIAHAHIATPRYYKRNRNEICMLDGAYVFSAKGVVDDVLVHEYCHVLSGPMSDELYRLTGGHNIRWRVWMERYGLEPLFYTKYLYR